MSDDPKAPDFWGDFSKINDPNYTGDGVDRRRWKFDEDGFPLAMNAALLVARQRLQEQTRTIAQDIMTTFNPVDFDVTIDGQPIDKATMQK